MRAAIALLLDDTAHNFIREMTVDIHRHFGLGYRAATHRPHITLKQGFPITELPAVVAYFSAFATGIPPLNVTFSHIGMVIAPDFDGDERGVLWLSADETPALRGLHNRLNRELAARFEDTAAPFDGENYQFHCTLFAGGAELASYHRAFDALKNTPITLKSHINRIGLFFQDDGVAGGNFITYRILPLGVR